MGSPKLSELCPWPKPSPKAKPEPKPQEQPKTESSPNPEPKAEPKPQETDELTEEQIRNSGADRVAVQNALDYLAGNRNLKNTLAYQDIRNQIASKSAPDLKSKEPSTQKPDLKSQEKPKAEPNNVSARDVDEAVDEFNDLLQQFSGKTNGNNVQFSFVADVKRFNEYLDAYQNSNLNKREPFEVTSEMPEVYKRIVLAFPDLQMASGGIRMFPSVIDKATGKIPSNYSKDRHNVSLDELRKLPESLHRPIMVLRGSWPNSLEILTILKDKNNRSVLAALQLNETDKYHTINRIATVFGKDKANYFLNKLAAGQGLYVNKKRALNWSLSAQVQSLRDVLLKVGSSNIIIDETDSASESQENTNTQFSFVPANNRNADIDVSKLSPEKVSIFSKLVTAEAKLGYRLIQRGNTNFAQWREAWLDKVGEGLANAGFSNHNIYELIESIWEDRYVSENGTGASLKNFARGQYLGASRVGQVSQNFDEQIDNRLEEIILGDSKQKGKLVHDLADEMKVGRKEMDDRVEILVGEMAKRIHDNTNRTDEAK